MNIYLDARCWQDEGYVFRGVGYHSSTLVAGARKWLPSDDKLIGLCNPEMAAIPDVYRSLLDAVEFHFVTPRERCAFVQLSPMTHDPSVACRFFREPLCTTATLVYDFIPLENRESYLTQESAIREYIEQMGWLANYDRFFPISEHASERLQSYMHIDSASIDVTGVALRKEFTQDATISTAKKAWFASKRPYFIFVGGGDQRKNVQLLIEAHASIDEASDLVIVGNYHSSEVERLQKCYKSLGGKQFQLTFKNGISDVELAQLYRESLCAVCCSKNEGFSLPVIEAIACGTPILLSDIGAHRELVNDERAFFSATDSSQLRERMTWLLRDSGSRNALLEKQSFVPQRFTQEKVSERFWRPLRTLLGGRENKLGWFPNKKSRPSIAIVTPFPPDASGVADYSRRTVEALGKIADVDVFTDAIDPIPTEGVKNFFPISEFAYTGGYDSTLAVVGNSHFHIKIIELQRKFGGPCLIHDNRLADLYCWWKGANYLASMASRATGRSVSTLEVDGWLTNPQTLPSVFFDDLVPTAQPLIVHSRGIQTRCLEEYNVEPEYLPFCCYRDFDIDGLTAQSRHQIRSKLGIPENQIAIISLGMVVPSKAPEVCLQTIAKLQRLGIEAHLYFVGTAGCGQASLEGYAESLGVRQAIHLRQEWFTETEYLEYTQAADFAIQLRTHFFGGLSGAMLDCIASGLPTVANKDLAEALESPSYVYRVDDRLDASEMAAAIARGIEHGDHLDRLKPERVKYIEEHTFDRYARELVSVLGLKLPVTSSVDRESLFADLRSRVKRKPSEFVAKF